MWAVSKNYHGFKHLVGSRPNIACVFYHAKTGVYGYKPSAWKNNGESVEHTQHRHVPPASASENHWKLLSWVNAYRQHGHKIATLDPLGLQKAKPAPELDPARYGLSLDDGTKHNVNDIFQSSTFQPSTLSDLKELLHQKYCCLLTAEFMHLKTDEEKRWFADRFEAVQEEEISPETKKELAVRLAKCQVFEKFLATKRQSLKRYGGEGSESQIAFFMQALRQCAEAGIEEVFICMAHRGRLSLLIEFFDFSPTVMFRKIDGYPEFPSSATCWGDVVSHLYCSHDIDYNGRNLHINFLPNPSHLEAVNPVALGKTRGRQQTLQEGDFSPEDEGRVGDKALCIQVHGDAAFVGQGVNEECFCLAEVPHFNTGGSIHLIINNQLGFTTPEDRGRSSDYCTDIAKMNGNPVIHVNGDDPEEVIKACKVAMDYRNTFRKDVLIDMVCYRVKGHNELDDPSMTQPVMYDVIWSKRSVPDLYSEKLVTKGLVTQEELSTARADHYKWLSDCLKEVDQHEPEQFNLQRHWAGIQPPPKFRTSWNTGVDTQLLQFVGMKSVELPSDFNAHPSVLRSHIKARKKKVSTGAKIDWSTAEAFAMGTLLTQGFPIRISGQDVGRGTFSHRHAALVDHSTDELYIPLNHMIPEQKAFLEVVNSPLSELAVLGFEYGMSIEHPNRLVIWEAQFGDFFNSAQVVIDTFVTTGEGKWLLQSSLAVLLPYVMDGAGPKHSTCHIERFLQMRDIASGFFRVVQWYYCHMVWTVPVRNTCHVILRGKWLLQSGLVLLLPHGMDGAGPDHSSCRIERFLQMCDSEETRIDTDDVNFHFCFPTNPAQYFHLLRRQMVRNFRKPLILVAPKGLLRLPAATSELADMGPDTTFQAVLSDNVVDPAQVKRVIFCTGKHYYALDKQRTGGQHMDTAIVRLECLCPFPAMELQQEMNKYPSAQRYVWSQEEHRNMGSWSFVSPRFKNLVGCELQYSGRGIMGASAVGVGQVHKAEAEKVVKEPFHM